MGISYISVHVWCSFFVLVVCVSQMFGSSKETSVIKHVLAIFCWFCALMFFGSAFLYINNSDNSY